MTRLSGIETPPHINPARLSGENYTTTLLQEACRCGMVTEDELQGIQLQSIALLARQCEHYSGGESSSLPTELAQNIMQSILFTIGLGLKAQPTADEAACRFKTQALEQLLASGRKTLESKLRAARHIYMLMQAGKIETPNYSYNDTLAAGGIGTFFKSYNPDYAAHEVPGYIDYQLFNPVEGVAGIEFMQKFMGNLLCENQFCSHFHHETIHQLLKGYHNEYEELLINIFEQVLTTALGCVMAGQNPLQLTITKENLVYLYSKLPATQAGMLTVLRAACSSLASLMDIKQEGLKRYMEAGLPQVAQHLNRAIKNKTLRLALPPLAL